MNRRLIAGLLVAATSSVSPQAVAGDCPDHVTVELQRDLVLENAYYSFDVNGLTELCATRRDMCTGATQLELDALQARRTWAWGLVGAGATAMMGGILYSMHRTFDCRDHDPFGDCIALAPIAWGAATGLAAVAVGYILHPDRSDLLRFVNTLNAASPGPVIRFTATPRLDVSLCPSSPTSFASVRAQGPAEDRE